MIECSPQLPSSGWLFTQALDHPLLQLLIVEVSNQESPAGIVPRCRVGRIGLRMLHLGGSLMSPAATRACSHRLGADVESRRRRASSMRSIVKFFRTKARWRSIIQAPAGSTGRSQPIWFCASGEGGWEACAHLARLASPAFKASMHYTPRHETCVQFIKFDKNALHAQKRCLREAK